MTVSKKRVDDRPVWVLFDEVGQVVDPDSGTVITYPERAYARILFKGERLVRYAPTPAPKRKRRRKR